MQEKASPKKPLITTTFTKFISYHSGKIVLDYLYRKNLEYFGIVADYIVPKIVEDIGPACNKYKYHFLIGGAVIISSICYALTYSNGAVLPRLAGHMSAYFVNTLINNKFFAGYNSSKLNPFHIGITEMVTRDVLTVWPIGHTAWDNGGFAAGFWSRFASNLFPKIMDKISARFGMKKMGLIYGGIRFCYGIFVESLSILGFSGNFIKTDELSLLGQALIYLSYVGSNYLIGPKFEQVKQNIILSRTTQATKTSNKATRNLLKTSAQLKVEKGL